MCKTSAVNAAATAARRSEVQAPDHSRTKAATSRARYTASPTAPCSAATVTGIVWDAAAARRRELSRWERNSSSKLPEP